MSSKRVKNQLTKDASLLDEGDSSDGESQMETPQIASAELMAKRKIAGMGRRFAKKVTPVVTVGESNGSTSNIIQSQMKSLNANFLKSINDGITKNPIADFTKICTKYLEYVKKVQSQQIEVKKLEVPKVDVKPEVMKTDDTKANPFSMFASLGANNTAQNQTTTQPQIQEQTKLAPTISKQESASEKVVNVDSESESEKEEEVKIQGPTFKIDKLPTTKGGFKFGVAPPKEDSDSEDEIEIKGPSFTTSVKVQDSVFKFPAKNEEKKTDETKIETTTASNDKPGVVSNGFNFNTDLKPTSGFSFGSKTEEKPISSSFNFSTQKEEKPVSTGFNFGKPAENNTPSTGFNFGKQTSEQSKPALSFNIGKSETQSAFSFGQNDENKTKTETTSNTPASKSAFTFEKKETPTFNFGNSTTTPKLPADSTSNTTTFNFGGQTVDASTTTSATMPKFNFGASTPATTAFSFGKQESTSETSKSNPFSFGGSTGSTSITTTPFNFSAPTPVVKASESNVEGDDESNEAEQDIVKGDFAVVKLTEKVEVKSGEESEDLIITKRSKVTKFNPESKSYDNVGLGELKVLKNKETGKSRILVRSEGSGNVILNILVLKEMKYDIMGKKNNMIRVPSVNVDGGLETYLLMVKTPNDANEVLEKLQQQQQQQN
ncbi:hypothetical protein CANINC_001444 [Pichia inconspicua]|uniref:RanBD1 domain-containing protein n=1 Tax=Pichia inconspicua TaxID=52247 RepID=A0A4T0X3Y6_9ASCO|nr:hypothetical protein CANINC_001444 [[Candida] inconspicua]